MLEPHFSHLQLGDWHVLGVAGELDMATAPSLRQQVVTMIAQGATKIVLDLGEVEFIDSTGLGVLVGSVKRVRTVEGELRVACDRQNILELFELTRLTNVFELFSDVAAATAE